MILVEIRPHGDGERETIKVHHGLTVVAGLDAADRRSWATDLARVLRGGPAESLDVEVEVDGTRRVLDPPLATELGLDDAGFEVTVFPLDLPGATPAAHAHDEEPATDDGPEDDAAVVAAQEALAAARARVAEIEQAAADALVERGRLTTDVSPDPAGAVAGLEAALDAARSEVVSARRAVEDVETRLRRMREMADAERNEAREAIQQLQDERDRLEAERTDVAARLAAAPDPGPPKAVEEALAGLRRLQQVRAKPSTKAIQLAEAWVDAFDRLQALPAPPQPPEWLVTPALAALQEAKAAVADAERGGPAVEVDPALVGALDQAHREVLEAEQRVMRKGSRSNRKRLESAHQAELRALQALGVGTYGEYLQRIAPHLADDGASREEQLAAARAALADAEAVWEELHDGQASPEWTAAKQHQAGIRGEALALLDREVDDADLEQALRSHVENVVDTGWAEQALFDALEAAGAQLPSPAADISADELQHVAERWLEESPAQREQRAALVGELAELDERLAAVGEQLTAKQSDAFFGEEDEAADDDIPDVVDGRPSLPELRERLAAAEEAERRAEADLEAARERVQLDERAKERLAELERTAAQARRDLEGANAELAAAESQLAEARDAVAADRAARDAAAAARDAAAAAAKASKNGVADLSKVVGMEAEAYLLARVAALRGTKAGPLPLVLEGAVLSGLPERASTRMHRLLARLAGSMQLVVLADDEETTRWAEGLGESAVVHSVAR